jgi:DNA-binding Lrp family transcriptional regulator
MISELAEDTKYMVEVEIMTVAVFIMLKVFMGHVQKVVESLRELKEATSVTVTTGEYDIIARFDLSDLEALYNLTVNHVGNIQGIESVTTAVVEKEF